MPITVRNLETLIRLATAHARLRLCKKIEEQDCDAAYSLVRAALDSKNDSCDSIPEADFIMKDEYFSKRLKTEDLSQTTRPITRSMKTIPSKVKAEPKLKSEYKKEPKIEPTDLEAIDEVYLS